MIRLFAAALILLAAPLHAAQDPLQLQRAVESFLTSQTQSLGGQVSFEIKTPDANNSLRTCSPGNIEVTLQPNARPVGRVSVTARCLDPGGWSLFVPVRIRVVADYLVAARPIAVGQTIAEADLGRQRGDLSELPAGTLTDPALVVDRAAATAIPIGRALRADMLRTVLSVRQGQSVRVVSRGPGFEVANEGKAMNNAAEGQVAQVRLNNGQIVSGIARSDGQVEIGR